MLELSATVRLEMVDILCFGVIVGSMAPLCSS
jgi:hypothetical protein